MFCPNCGKELVDNPGDIIGIKVAITEMLRVSFAQVRGIGTSAWPSGLDALDVSTYAKLVLSK